MSFLIRMINWPLLFDIIGRWGRQMGHDACEVPIASHPPTPMYFHIGVFVDGGRDAVTGHGQSRLVAPSRAWSRGFRKKRF